MSDAAPSDLSPFGMIACIAAIVLGVLGVVGTVLQLITSLMAGGGTLFMVFSSEMSHMQASLIWGMVAVVIGALIYIVGFLLCLGAAGAGAFGLARKTVGPVIGFAVLIAIFDLLCHVIWPWIAVIINMVAQSTDIGWDVAMATSAIGIPGLVVGTIWSLVLLALWAAVAGFGIQERRQAVVLD